VLVVPRVNPLIVVGRLRWGREQSWGLKPWTTHTLAWIGVNGPARWAYPGVLPSLSTLYPQLIDNLIQKTPNETPARSAHGGWICV